MKVLVDECVDWRLSREILGHEVKTARQMGWSTIQNGALLALATSGRTLLSSALDVERFRLPRRWGNNDTLQDCFVLWVWRRRTTNGSH